MTVLAGKTIVAIPGSLRKRSSNHLLLEYLQALAPADTRFVIFNGVGEMPLFNPDLNNDKPPAPVKVFRDLLATADGAIICTPEYAFGVPGALKNALDWTVSSGSLAEKQVMLITASTNGQHAHASLLLTLEALSAKLQPDTALIVPFIGSRIDSNGTINDEKTAEYLKKAFDLFVKNVKQGQ